MPLTPDTSPNLIQTDFAFAYDSAGNVGTSRHSIAGGQKKGAFNINLAN